MKRFSFFYGLVVIASLSLASEAFAQADPKKKVIEPEEVTFTTKDNVELVATYYASSEGKEAVPIIMLHAYGPKHSRADFHPLALEMQKLGYAVLAPDFRGHGASTKHGDEKLTPDIVQRALPGLAVDVEECKKFILAKHRAEHLNVDRLVIVAAEEATIVAINYTALDWSFPPLGSKKQGQDVKALVLLSPMWSYRTMNVGTAIQTVPLQKLVWGYFIVGKKKTDSRIECDRVYNMMAMGHVVDDPVKDTDKEKDLYYYQADTQLQGTQMLTVANLELSRRIGQFIHLSAASKKDYDWKPRD